MTTDTTTPSDDADRLKKKRAEIEEQMRHVRAGQRWYAQSRINMPEWHPDQYFGRNHGCGDPQPSGVER